MTIRVLMADDHPVVRTGIRAMIAHESDMTVVGEAGDGAEIVSLWLVPNGKLVESMDTRMSMSGLCRRSFSHRYHSFGDDRNVSGRCWVAGCVRSSIRRIADVGRQLLLT